jgi:hypothetical protein
MPPETEQAPAPSQRMGGLLMGHFAAQCVHVVAVLGIADLLLNGHDTIEALASATRCHGHSLQRVLRILVRLGVFTETAAGRYGLTAVGATLRGDTSDSLRDAAIFAMSPPLWARVVHFWTLSGTASQLLLNCMIPQYTTT